MCLRFHKPPFPYRFKVFSILRYSDCVWDVHLAFVQPELVSGKTSPRNVRVDGTRHHDHGGGLQG